MSINKLWAWDKDKKFYKNPRFWIIVVGFYAVLFAIIPFMPETEKTESDMTIQVMDNTPVAEPKDFTGQLAYEAYHELVAEGFVVTAKTMQCNTVSEMDISFKYEPESELTTKWLVAEQKNEKSDDTYNITLCLGTEEGINASAAENATRDALQAKLDKIDAELACKYYGEAQYPYGFKVHSIVGRLAEGISSSVADAWFFKTKVTIENAYGNKYDTIMECHVTGTTAAPVVSEFIVD
jgi:hypothetical protein